MHADEKTALRDKRPFRSFPIAIASGLTVLVLLALVGPALAQEPPIGRLEILVENPSNDARIGVIAPGETFVVNSGQRIRLRMTAVPTASNRGARYPSTEFTPQGASSRHVNIEKINPQVGSIIMTATSPHAAPTDAEVFLFHVLDQSLNMDPKLATGRVYVKVQAPPPPPPPTPAPTPTPPPSDNQRPGKGVTLYRDANWSGYSERFTADDPNLQDNPIGNDSVSSLRVDAGCEVVLYKDTNYRGDATATSDHIQNLRGSEVGNDSASSLRLFCDERRRDRDRDRRDWRDRDRNRGPRDSDNRDRNDDWRDRDRDRGRARGAVLFEHPGYEGRSELFTHDDPSLRDNPIGNDAVSSLYVDRGCRVVLWEDEHYRGNRMVVTGDIDQLRGTDIGADSVSSIQVDCR